MALPFCGSRRRTRRGPGRAPGMGRRDRRYRSRRRTDRRLACAGDCRPRDPGDLLEGRAFQDLGELVFGGLTDLFDCPASGLGVQPPDRAEPAARERSVRELSPRSEVECREQARDVVLGEGRHHSRMMPVCCDPTLLSARTLPLGLLMAGPPGQDRSRLHRPSGRPGGGRRPARTAFRASSRRG